MLDQVDAKTSYGSVTIESGRGARWHIGPLSLTIARLEHEWRIAREAGPDFGDLDRREAEVPPSRPIGGGEVTRYGVENGGHKLRVLPILPNRSVVTRPEQPLSVLARENVRMYVGCPLWVRVETVKPERLLDEFPALLPRRTFWGENTREGELCYATRTYGRLRLSDVVRHPHRVLTQVTIANRTNLPLPIDRLNLPVRQLSVYQDEAGDLWTEDVTLKRAEDAEYAELVIHAGAPAAAPDAERLSEPRDTKPRGLFRAFGSLFN